MFLILVDQKTESRTRLIFDNRIKWGIANKLLVGAMNSQQNDATVHINVDSGFAFTCRASALISVLAVDCTEDEKVTTKFNVFKHNMEHRIEKAMTDGCELRKADDRGNEPDAGLSNVKH